MIAISGIPAFRDLPVTMRVPLVTAALMIVLGLVASQSVLTALGRVQDARLSETARLHVEGLSVALGPAVLRADVWEVYDILDRARSAFDGQRLVWTVVADERGRVLAATDPHRAPVGAPVAGYEAVAVAPGAVRMTGAAAAGRRGGAAAHPRHRGRARRHHPARPRGRRDADRDHAARRHADRRAE